MQASLNVPKPGSAIMPTK